MQEPHLTPCKPAAHAAHAAHPVLPAEAALTDVALVPLVGGAGALHPAQHRQAVAHVRHHAGPPLRPGRQAGGWAGKGRRQQVERGTHRCTQATLGPGAAGTPGQPSGDPQAVGALPVCQCRVGSGSAAHLHQGQRGGGAKLQGAAADVGRGVDLLGRGGAGEGRGGRPLGETLRLPPLGSCQVLGSCQCCCRSSLPPLAPAAGPAAAPSPCSCPLTLSPQDPTRSSVYRCSYLRSE